MALNRVAKEAIVTEVSAVARQATSLVAADYRGLEVAEMTKLRQEARRQGVYLKVVRNTLARRAVKDTDFACAAEVLVGPLVLAFSGAEPGSAARLLRDFAKTTEKLKVTALSVGGQLYGAGHLEKVASLPTKAEALSQLMALMQEPVTRFVRTVAAPASTLVRTLDAVRVQKESQA